jgi:tetratricopeptide (TPR) repeat protein
MPRLLTLGKLRLEDDSFSEKLPLLILAYLCVEGKTPRSRLASLFWAEQMNGVKRSKSLSEVLRKLASRGLIASVENEVVEAVVASDVQEFRQACKQLDPRTRELYRGSFLADLEDNQRLHLSQELLFWLADVRDELQDSFIAFLLQSSRTLVNNLPNEAAALALRALNLPDSRTHPSEATLRAIYSLLLRAGQAKDIEKVKRKAKKSLELTLSSWLETLPVSSSSFIGREDELAVLSQWLRQSDSPLMTIMGLGGVGKTELAIRLAQDHAQHVSEVYMVSLETLAANASEQDIIAATARVLKLSAYTQEKLVQAINAQSTLLILDNCEHLPAVSSLVASLIKNCPHLKLLATSRRLLKLKQEKVITLEGLNPLGNAADLFIDLCQAKGLSIKDRKPVEQICTLVDGLPLAIHLAASWARAIPLPEIASRLQDNVGFLEHPQKDVHPKHHGIESVFETSLALLKTHERHALLGLSIFRGPVCLESVKTILNVSTPVIKSLVEKSLLRFSPASHRYSLHPLLGLYIFQSLKGLDDDTHIRQGYSQYYLEKLLRFDLGDQARELLNEEFVDVAEAWNIAAEGDTKLYDYVPHMQSLCDGAARYQEGINLLETALVKACGNTKGRLLATKAWFLGRLGKSVEAKELAEKVLEVVKEDLKSLSTLYILMGSIYDDAAEFEQARSYFEKDAALHLKHTAEAANASSNLAFIRYQMGHYEQAQTHAEQALHFFEQEGNLAKQLQLTNVQAQIYLATDEIFKARLLLENSLERVKGQKLQHGVPMLEVLLARVHAQSGEEARATYLCQKLIHANSANLWNSAKALVILGDLALQENEIHMAYQHYKESLIMVKPTRSIPGILLRLLCLGSVLEDSPLVARLYAYVQQHQNKMSKSDQWRLESFGKRDLSKYPRPTNDWFNLSAHEVATLALSDAAFIKEKAQPEFYPD